MPLWVFIPPELPGSLHTTQMTCCEASALLEKPKKKSHLKNITVWSHEETVTSLKLT